MSYFSFFNKWQDHSPNSTRYRWGKPKFENAEGIGTLSVGSHEEDEKSGDITVTGKLGAGSEGQKEGIFFCGCDADTRWIYEWKKVG